jgi:hypothetical protein
MLPGILIFLSKERIRTHNWIFCRYTLSLSLDLDLYLMEKVQIGNLKKMLSTVF